MNNPVNLVVFISGNGSNLQSIIEAIECDQVNACIKVVISNNADAYGLTRAKKHGIETRVIDHRLYASRVEFDQQLLQCVNAFETDYIVLAGFMRILGEDIIRAYANRILNIHPSLLPDYKGLHTHQRALDNCEHQHGVSIHLVTAELDDGPVLLQGRYPVERGDTVTTLQARGHALEHRMYPAILKWLCEKRLRIETNAIYFNNQILREPVEFNDF